MQARNAPKIYLHGGSCGEAEGLCSDLEVHGKHEQGRGLPVAEQNPLDRVIAVGLLHQRPDP